MGRPRGGGPPKQDLFPETLQREEINEVDPIDKARAKFITMNAGFFFDYAESLKIISERLPGRSTIRQAYAFLLIVSANAAGQTITAKRLREIGGRGPDGEDVLGQAIQKTYQVLLEASEYNPDGVGWVYTEMDKSDRRNNLLKLTNEGVRMAEEIRNLIQRRGSL